jgi:hypothetical protein
MSQRLFTISKCAIIMSLCFLVFTSEAEARRLGIPLLIFNTGDEMFPVADLPADLNKDSEGNEMIGWKLGYKCSHFGILWADVWCWDKELCSINENENAYSDLPAEMKTALGKRYPFSKTKRNPWNKYGIFILGAVALAIALARKSESNSK